MKKKLLAAVLTLTMLLGLMPTTVWAEGDITTISSAAELKALAEAVNGGNDYSGKTVTLTADIDLEGSEENQWTPIGTGNYTSFKGTFDGGGHKVTGLYINNTADNQGLFGFVGAGGKVQNLSVSGTVTSGRYVGGVVGLNKGTVTGCCYTGEVTGSQYVGGVVGFNGSNCIVEKCYNTGKVTGTKSFAGGVVGQSYGPVKNCYNTGAVTGTETLVGGVVGENNSIVENCYNTGTVTGTENKAGGVVGCEGTKVTSCYFLAGKGPEHSIGNNASSAEGITADAFKEQTTFTDWDFSTVWTMGAERPVLKDNPEPEPLHSHPVCGETCSHSGAHEDVTWQKLTRSDFSNKTNGVTYSSGTYTLAAGSYYLAEDIPINAVLRVTTGTTVKLCLNGHKISNNFDAPNSFLDVYGALTLCSCVAGGEVSTTYATVCINTCRNTATADLYDVKVTGKLVGISNSGTLTVSGGEVINGISNIGTSSAKLILIGSPTIHDDTAALQLKTAGSTTLENAAVDATKYTGGMLKVKEYLPSWEKMSDRIGAYAIKVSDESKDKFTLTNTCYKYEYNNGGMVIREDHTGGTATCTAKAVCTTCGQSYGELAAHTWGETYEKDENQHWRKCSVCDAEDSAAHTPGDWIIDQAATVEAAGSKHRECTVCHYTTETAAIPKLEQPDPGPDPDPTYSISGVVQDSNHTAASGVTVKLKKGNETISTATTDSDGKYSFSGVKAGTYNVVAEKSGVIKTILVVLTDENVTVNTIKMPEGSKNSVVEVTGAGTPAVVVGGVDAVAEAQEVTGVQTVTVTLTVEKKTESAAANASEIKQAANGKTVEFLDLSLVRTVDNGTPQAITDTGDQVLEIIVPYDFTGKKNVTVYRYHDNKAESLTQAGTGAGGTFKLGADSIIIYATKFSTYAIGYSASGGGTSDPTPPSPPPSSGGGSSGDDDSGEPTYTPSVDKAPHGKIEVRPQNPEQGERVTVLLTPYKGYQIGSLTVTDRNGKPVTVTDQGGGRYTFIQPGGKVTVTGAFTKITGGYKDCSRDSTCPLWTYTDTDPAAWYHDGIHYCIENGLMNGYGSGRFGPNDNLTRAQFAKLLHNREGRPAVNYLLQYGDVAEDAWYTEAVRWATSQGIVGGYGSGKFGPDDNITREQLAVMLWRYAGSPKATDRELHFSDTDQIGGYAQEALRWAVENGIINGYSDGRIGPQGLATRAQVASMLMRYGTKIT